MEASYNPSENIIIVNKESFDAKLKQFIADGISWLRLVTDFDQTLTKAYVNDCKGSSTFGVLHESEFVSTALISKSQANYEYYSKIERDQLISLEDKKRYMDEWWEDALLNITQECISRDNFVSMTECSNLQFRNGIWELITLKNRFDFPFMIVSAGIGEIIKSAFHLFAKEQEIDEEFFNKIFILSNLGIYNERNVLVGFESPTQTIMNKDENIKKRYEKTSMHFI